MVFTIATYTIYTIVALLFTLNFLAAIADICEQRKAERAKLNSIPTMTVKQLKALAKQYKLTGTSRMNKYQLSNYLIMELC